MAELIGLLTDLEERISDSPSKESSVPEPKVRKQSIKQEHSGGTLITAEEAELVRRQQKEAEDFRNKILALEIDKARLEGEKAGYGKHAHFPTDHSHSSLFPIPHQPCPFTPLQHDPSHSAAGQTQKAQQDLLAKEAELSKFKAKDELQKEQNVEVKELKSQLGDLHKLKAKEEYEAQLNVTTPCAMCLRGVYGAGDAHLTPHTVLIVHRSCQSCKQRTRSARSRVRRLKLQFNLLLHQLSWSRARTSTTTAGTSATGKRAAGRAARTLRAARRASVLPAAVRARGQEERKGQGLVAVIATVTAIVAATMTVTETVAETVTETVTAIAIKLKVGKAKE